jgi:hypothetical protein
LHLTIRSCFSPRFFVDTDGIGYSLEKTVPNPLTFSNCTGDFKAVQTNIQSFHALGNRNYTIGYLDTSNTLKFEYKVKGLTLTSEHASNIMSPHLYGDFLANIFVRFYRNLYTSGQKKVNVIDKQSTTKMHPVKFSNNLFIKRYIKPDLNIQTH